MSWTDLMKEYRKLDDSITMRLNRTIAQYRDMDRVGSAGKGTVEERACLQVWRELVGPCVNPHVDVKVPVRSPSVADV